MIKINKYLKRINMKKLSLSFIVLISWCTVHAQQNVFPTASGNAGIYTLAPTNSLTIGYLGNGIAAYNTADQTTNYQRMVQGWNSGIYQIGAYFGGTASAPSIQFGMQPTAGTTTLSGGQLFTINNTTSTTAGIFDFNTTTAGTGSIITIQGNATASSGVQNFVSIQPSISQTGTAGYRALLISPWLGVGGSGTANYLIDAGTSSAAHGSGTYTSKFVVTSAGNVGINTATPADNLDITGYDPIFRITDVTSGNSSFFQQLNNTYGGCLRINDGTTYSTRFIGGNVGIGTTDDASWQLATSIYRLAVGGGGIVSTSVTVKLVANWPDYVFNKDYELPSLTTVKTFIDQNHHLPDMPSEQQIAKDGINLGEMNKLLTKKVEELTLYLIEKDKKDREQSTQLKSQQDQINLLIKQVAELSKKK
jgi:hypothetical protein